MLTERALKYLASLERLPPLPSRKVEAIIRDQGMPCFPPWLDFQERYAGYIEPIGADTAVWGLVHQETHWHTPGEATIDQLDEKSWIVICAEVHPSYNYVLDQDGEFGLGRAISFDVKVEQNALLTSFGAKGPTRYLHAELRDPSFAERIRKELESCLEKAASDKYRRYYANDRFLVREDPQDGKLVDGWQRA